MKCIANLLGVQQTNDSYPENMCSPHSQLYEMIFLSHDWGQCPTIDCSRPINSRNISAALQDDAAAPQTDRGSEGGGATTSMIYSNCQVPFRRPTVFRAEVHFIRPSGKNAPFPLNFLSDIQSLPPPSPPSGALPSYTQIANTARLWTGLLYSVNF